MKIERIEIRHIKMKLNSPFKTSFGVEEHIEHIIVQIDSEGLTGWGECVPFVSPSYTYETTETAWNVLTKFLIPPIIGKDLNVINDLLVINSKVRGHQMAKAGVEAAFYDLLAKQNGKSLAQMFGGNRERVDVGVSIGIQESEDELLKIAGSYLEEGYKRIKLKIMPGYDVGVISSFRKEFPNVMLQVDANSAYNLSDVGKFVELDNYKLLLVEQPLGHNDFYEHAILQEQINTPLCLDESIESFPDSQTAVKLGSCKSINLKPARVGGFTEAINIHNFCMKENIPVWHGGMLETGIGRAGNLALASLPNFVFPADISASERYFTEDIVEPAFVLNSDGTIDVPQKAGIGVDIIADRLKSVTQNNTVFK